MKKLLSLLIVSAFVFGLSAQTQTQTKAQELEQIKAQITASVCEELDKLPAEVQTKLQAAKQAAVKAQTLIKQMKMSGASDDKVNAELNRIRTEAMAQLDAAIQNMENASSQVKAQVKAAKGEIERHLATKEAEMKQIQEQSQSRTGGGTRP